MSNLTENSFQRLSDPIMGVSEQFTLRLLRIIKDVATRLSSDPEAVINVAQILRLTEDEWQDFIREADDWADDAMAQAYLKGIRATNGNVPNRMIPDQPIGSPTMVAGGSGGGISETARRILKDYPEHHTMYGVFREQAGEAFRSTRVPVVRDVEGIVREVIINASEREYKNADPFTRRQMTQGLINEFARNNISGIRYSDGRTMSIDAYSEMVARSQTGNAAREAALRRQEQYGLDLVQISQHYPSSDLCVDWQGRVYSISGTDEKYPPLQAAIEGGLYHSNCKHSQSAYIPGTSKLPDKEMTKTRNKRQYAAQQRQRYNERQIRMWKRREAGALTDEELRKAKGKVRQWQARQRELLDSNDFLRRKYSRESITG